ncbi:hypothetical protein ACJJTC_015708 [Scirpophaga incertulas]
MIIASQCSVGRPKFLSNAKFCLVVLQSFLMLAGCPLILPNPNPNCLKFNYRISVIEFEAVWPLWQTFIAWHHDKVNSVLISTLLFQELLNMEKNRNVSLQVDGKGKKKKDKIVKDGGEASASGREKCLVM